MNRKTIFSAAASMLVGVSLVAGAVSPASAYSDPPKAKQEEPAPAAKVDARKYCFDTQQTGTRIAKRECRTRDAWISERGIDPLEVQKR